MRVKSQTGNCSRHGQAAWSILKYEACCLHAKRGSQKLDGQLSEFMSPGKVRYYVMITIHLKYLRGPHGAATYAYVVFLC